MRKLLGIFFVVFLSSDAYCSGNNKINSLQNEAARKRMLSKEEIESVAQDFESVAITKMLQHMYEGVKVDPIFSSSSTEGIYKDLLLTEYGKIISENGGIGIKDSIVRDMENMNKGKRHG